MPTLTTGPSSHPPPSRKPGPPPARQDVRFARATPSDLQALVALEQASFRSDRISPRSWRHLLGSHSARVLVARSAAMPGLLLGAAVLLRRAHSAVGRLYSLAIEPTQRGRGLGERLLELAQQHTRADGAAVLRLETRADNHAAQRLFKRQGFTPLERVPGYYEDGADALRFQKSLWDGGRAMQDAAPRAPFHDQTLDFSCGPCALLIGENSPHPRVVTGFDGQAFRILAPIAATPAGEAPGASVSVEEFKRIARCGRRRQAAAVPITKGS